MNTDHMSIYPFKTPPYAHQYAVWNKSKDEAYHGLFMEMGTGKTKVIIDNAAYLYDQGKIDGLIIIAPKGTYRVWYDYEIEKHMPDHIDWAMHLWQSSRTATQSYLREVNQFLNSTKMRLKILIVNVEGMVNATSKSTKLVTNFMKKRSNVMMVVDESTCIKNPNAKRTKIVTKLGKEARYRRIMTGMAIPNGPLDVYSQANFLSPGALGYTSYMSFKAEYSISEDRHIGYNRVIKAVVGYRNTDQLKAKLQNFCSLVKKDDCLDLPSKVYVYREMSMSPEQQKWYDEMKRDSIILLNEIDTVSAKIALTQLVKLHQITCGFTIDDDGNLLEIPTTLWDEVLDWASEIQGKAIIWSPYRYGVRKIRDTLVEKFGPNSLALYYGETKANDRVESVSRFQEDPECRFFIGTPQTGGFGLTLTAASHELYISNSFNLEHRLQSEDRAHRIGQTKSVVITDIVIPDTISSRILAALKAKKTMGDMVLNWQELLDV